MWRRGANLEGDTANFIETEQLFELEGFKCSLLQVHTLSFLEVKDLNLTRTVPKLWNQLPIYTTIYMIEVVKG